MATAQDTLTRDKLYIGGEWVEPDGSRMIDVINPSTEEAIGRIPEGTAEDADRAVRAARDAFDSWSSLSPHERAGYCEAIGAGLAARGDELAAPRSSSSATSRSLASWACPSACHAASRPHFRRWDSRRCPTWLRRSPGRRR